MKNILIALCIFTSVINANAQKVDIGLNFGNISGLSVGLSTWKWLYIGVSYKTSNLLYIPGNNSTIKKTFYTPMIFLQPTVNINKNMAVYGAFNYGYYFDNTGYLKHEKNNNFIISTGLNVRVFKRIWANGEVGYMQINATAPTMYVFPAVKDWYKPNRVYGAVGIRFMLNTGEHKAKKKPQQ